MESYTNFKESINQRVRLDMRMDTKTWHHSSNRTVTLCTGQTNDLYLCDVLEHQKNTVLRNAFNKRTAKCILGKLQSIVIALGWEQQYGVGEAEIWWMELNVKLTNICHREIFYSLQLFFPIVFQSPLKWTAGCDENFIKP